MDQWATTKIAKEIFLEMPPEKYNLGNLPIFSGEILCNIKIYISFFFFFHFESKGTCGMHHLNLSYFLYQNMF